jgi:hypothetical protein
MPDKSNNGQPSIEKLTSEGVSIRKCISYGEGGEYGGGSKPAKPAPATGSLASMRMGKGKGY